MISRKPHFRRSTNAMIVLVLGSLLAACDGSRGEETKDGASAADLVGPADRGTLIDLVGRAEQSPSADGTKNDDAGADGAVDASVDLPPPRDGAAPDSVTFCGTPGAACCAGDVCNAGGCCEGGRCIASGQSPPATSGLVCSNAAVSACGVDGLPCCERSACGAGGCCVFGICVADGADCEIGKVCSSGSCSGLVDCGGKDESCCLEDGTLRQYCTNPALVCLHGPLPALCKDCGGSGQPCCAGQACDDGGCCVVDTCVANGASCGASSGTCDEGRCDDGACGGPGQPCCPSPVGCTAPFSVCDGDTNRCTTCGGDGEACCRAIGPAGGAECLPPYRCATLGQVCVLIP